MKSGSKSCKRTSGCIGPEKHEGDCVPLASVPGLFAREALEIAKSWARRMRARRSVQS